MGYSSELGARRAEAPRLSEQNSSRVEGVILTGDAAVKVRKEVIVILHSRPHRFPGVVVHAASESPDVAGVVKMTGEIIRVGEACIANLTFD